MLKELVLSFAADILSIFVFIRFRNIWDLKSFLRNENGNKKKKHPVLSYIYAKYFSRKGSFIGIDSNLKKVPTFPHDTIGVFISCNAEIGEGCTIFQQVTIGSNTLSGSKRRGSPIIGNHVYIGAGAKIIGNVQVGDHCRIGANATVVKDMPPHSVAVAAPVRLIEKSNLDNRHITLVAFNKQVQKMSSQAEYAGNKDGEGEPVEIVSDETGTTI